MTFPIAGLGQIIAILVLVAVLVLLLIHELPLMIGVLIGALAVARLV